MAKASAALKPRLVHPASTSRIERASTELTGPSEDPKPEEILKMIGSAIERFGVRPMIKALSDHKDELTLRLLAMVEREGETMIVKGREKVVYETDAHKFQVINGQNVYIGEQELRLVMTSLSIPPKQQEKILKCKKVTDYKYVGVYKVKAEEDGE